MFSHFLERKKLLSFLARIYRPPFSRVNLGISVSHLLVEVPIMVGVTAALAVLARKVSTMSSSEPRHRERWRARCGPGVGGRSLRRAVPG